MANTHPCVLCERPNSVSNAAMLCVQCHALITSVKTFFTAMKGLFS